MIKFHSVVLVVLCLFCASCARKNAGIEMTRNPYIQWESETSRVVLAQPSVVNGVVSLRYLEASSTEVGSLIEMKADAESGFLKATMVELKPNANYKYRIECNEKETNWKEFAMPSKAGDATPFRFAYYGDTRTYFENHKKVADAVAKEKDITFILCAGDLVTAGDELEQWQEEFFSPAEKMLEQTVVFPCFGNHEQHSKNYTDNFNLPKNPGDEAYYSFNAGLVHITVIDQYQDYAPNSVQGKWIAKDLEDTPDEFWKIVMFHEPPFSSSKKRGLGMKAIKRLCDVLEKNNVDLVVNGHDHFYLRTHPIGQAGKRGVVYVVTGGGGAPTYEAQDKDFIAKKDTGLHYNVVDVTDKKLSIQTKRPSGEVIDSFVLEKNQDVKLTLSRTKIITKEQSQEDLAIALRNAALISFVDVEGNSKEMKATLKNNLSTKMNIKYKWKTKGTAWEVTPVVGCENGQILIEAGKSKEVSWRLTLNDENNAYPAPYLIAETQLGILKKVNVLVTQNVAESSLKLVSAPLKLDGVGDESFWKDVKPLGRLLREDGKGFPKNETILKSVAGVDGLYVFVTCEENNMEGIRARAKKRDSNKVWSDDCVELFVESVRGSGKYLQFVISATGHVFDAEEKKKAWNGNWKTVVTRDSDKWSAEIFIPWGDLEMSSRPCVGAQLGFNLGRTENEPRKDKPKKFLYVCSQWSLTFGSSHTPERFGVLTVEK